MKKKLLLIPVILILGIFVYVTSISYSLYKFHDAVYLNDEKLISETVDFESLRKYLKEDINGVMIDELNKDNSTSQAMNLLALGFASKIADMVIDVYASPKGITTLLKESDYYQELPKPNLLKSYLVINRFNFNGANEIFYVLKKDGNSIPIHFKRYGIEWKLFKLKIDPKLLNKNKY